METAIQTKLNEVLEVSAVIAGSLPLDNLRHETLVRSYIKCGVKTTAYSIAYPDACDETCRNVSQKTLKLPKVAARLAYLRSEALSILDLTSDTLLMETLRIARANITDVMDGKGNILPPSDWPEDAARAIKAVRITTRGCGENKEVTVEPIFHNKQPALDSLMKHKGLFEKDNDQRKPALYLEVTRSEE